MANAALGKVKVDCWIKYGYAVGNRFYWYFGQVKVIKETGIGRDGDPYILAEVEFTEETEDDVMIWSSHEHVIGASGWELMTEAISGRRRAVFVPEVAQETGVTPGNEMEAKINAYFAEYRAKFEDLNEKVDHLTKTQEDYSLKIDHLKGQVTRITNQYQRFVKNTQEHTIRSLCEQYMPSSVLTEQQISEAEKRFIYPPMLSGVKRVAEWNIGTQCCHMFHWNQDTPQCKGARFYMKELKHNTKGEEKPGFTLADKEDIQEGNTYYWLMNPNSRPLSYHVAITRMWRTEPWDKAIDKCHDYAICKDCVEQSGNPDQYICVTSKDFCHVCVLRKSITSSYGSQDRKVNICASCNDACGTKDDLRYILAVIKYLFPLNGVVVNNTSLDRNTPDTTIEFNTSINDQFHTILIEMDTSQHRGVSASREVDKKEEMTKTILLKNKHARVFIIRFCPGGDFVNRSGEAQGVNVLTTAQRLMILRSWIIWYMATAEYGAVPPFLVLYLWYSFNCTKVKEAKERLGDEYIGQSYGYPKKGVWKYYASSPDEQKVINSWKFDETGCRGENVEDVFSAYDNFSALELPASVRN